MTLAYSSNAHELIFWDLASSHLWRHGDKTGFKVSHHLFWERWALAACVGAKWGAGSWKHYNGTFKKKKKRLFSWEKDKPVVVFPKQSSPGPSQHLGETESLLGCFTAAQHWTGAANPSAWTDCPCDSDSLAVVTSVLSPWQPQVWQMWQSCVLSANSLANPLLALVRKAYG